MEPVSPDLRGPLHIDEVKGLFVADTGNHRILHLEANASTLFTLVEKSESITDGGMNAFSEVALKESARVSILMGIGVRAEADEGSPACSLPIANPTGMSLDPSGNLFVAGDGVISVIAPNQSPLSLAPSECAGSSRFGRGTLSNVYPNEANRYPGSATKCLSAIFAKSEDLVFALDGCQGIALQLDAAP
ncbi:MAG: hypothetical protein GY822_16720 [Deltaproteobacteria bacterium]|nr:hypothetical protein [Deltaproteobacteria bacterium]